MPPSITKTDIFNRGTSLTRGILDRRADSARRVVLAENLVNDDRDLDDVITLAAARDGDFHPIDTDLPLASITAQKFRTNKAWGIMRYRRSAAATPTRPANELVNRRTGMRSIAWYRDTTAFDSTGRPNGAITTGPRPSNVSLSSATLLPYIQPWQWSFGVIVLTMSTVLDAPPHAAFTDYIGCINSNNVYQFIATGGFPPYTLMFNGFASSPIEVQGGTRHVVQWQAIYNPFQWMRMKPPVYDTSESEWTTTLEYSAIARTFPRFTVHA